MDTSEEQVIAPEEEVEQPLEESTEVTEEVNEEVQDEEIVEEQPEESEPEPEEPKPSRRESLRIQQLISKMKQETPQQQSQVRPGIDYGQALDADPEVIAQLEQDRQGYGRASYDEGIKRAESIQFHTRLEIDAPRVMDKYPVLNPDSEQFNPAVADALNDMYLSSVGYNQQTDTVANPNVRYGEYIEGMMELSDAVASEKNTKTAKNIAKQAASTGLRPDGSRAKSLNLNKAPQDMTDEELSAYLKSAGL